MRITSRRKTIITFLVLGVGLATVAVAVGFGWIIFNWREGVRVFLGVIFFGAITAGLILNTIFLVREIRRNEQHDSFINAVTHELKTPIASIRLYLQTLQQREVDDAKRAEFYRIMLNDTDRLMTTVEQVLKAGALGGKHHASDFTPINLAALAEECAELARVRHNLPAEALRFESNGQTPTVQGDADDLRAAISNVLDNAVKYSGSNVEVRMHLHSLDEKTVTLSVRDCGVGIPRDQLKRIFRRFYRVPNRAIAHVKGTGLGLFIVRSVTHKHRGRVYAESGGEGQGTTISIQLPIVPAASPLSQTALRDSKA